MRCRAEPAFWSPHTPWVRTLVMRRPLCSTRDGSKPRRTVSQACSYGLFRSRWGYSSRTLTGILAIYDAIGDDTLSGKPDVVGNHGLARSRQYWGTMGLSTSDVGECNTFVVPSSLVR